MPADDGALYVSELFPPDDRVALFVVSMLMAANDLEFSLRRAAAANGSDFTEQDLSDHRFYFLVRVANGFLFEAIDALETWCHKEEEVQQLLKKLPPKGRDALKRVRKVRAQTGKKTLASVRHHTFHYPHPDASKDPDSTIELAETIRDGTAGLVADADAREASTHTFPFAEQVALRLAMRHHSPEEEEANKQVTIIENGIADFVTFARHLHILYCKRMGVPRVAVD
jgi:hypothetical protein